MADAFKLPRVRAADSIADSSGKASNAFVRFWDTVMKSIERQETGQNTVISTLSQVVDQQQAQLVLITQALQLAGLALETADGGGASRSGQASAFLNVSGTGWINGPQVDLLTVSAGTFTDQATYLGIGDEITPTDMSSAGTTNGEVRVVEIVGGVDTVLVGPYAFTATGLARPMSSGLSVVVSFDPALATASLSRSTTGSVSYRLDVRRIDGPTITNLAAGLFVRRAA